jgi:hypothetical protein
VGGSRPGGLAGHDPRPGGILCAHFGR